MAAFLELCDAYSGRWLAAMVAIVWQSTLVALAIGIVARLLRHGSPAVRYWLWQIAALKLLVMPLWTMSLVSPFWGAPEPLAAQPPSVERARDNGPSDEPGVVASLDLPAHDAPAKIRPAGDNSRVAGTLGVLRWQTWLLLVWLAVLAVEVLLLCWQRFRLARFLKSAQPADEAIVQLVARAAQTVGLRRSVRVLAAAAPISPFVCGIWRPCLVLPANLLSTFADDDVTPIVLHELAHVRRRDLLWGWIPQLACGIYFFHPVAHWINRQVRLERELACDGWAMTASGRPAADYADLLVRVVSATSRPQAFQLSAGAGLDGNENL